MRIPSGVTDQYVYFFAADATDFTTAETGLASFTVYRSRNGGAAAAMTTPTINETDVTNMPGVYELLLDEDMTIDSGDDSQEMIFYITHAGMYPVKRTIELYRPKITAGNTLDVTATGAAGIDWGNIENKTTANDLSGTDIQLCDTVTTNTDMRGTDSAYTGTPPTAAAIADAVLDEALSGHTTAGTLGKAVADTETDVTSILSYAAPTASGTADSGSTTTMVDAARTEADDDYWKGSAIRFTSGTISGQVRLITGFTASSDTITFEPATTQAVSTNTYEILSAAGLASILEDTGTTIPALIGTPTDLGGGATLADNAADLAGATFSTTTDSLEALRNRGDAAWTTGAGGTPPQLLQNTTIATLASQTSFTLTAGSADDDAYNGAVVVVTDQSTSTQKAVGSVSDYTGSTKTITLSSDPGIFTMATGDTIDIIANASTAPTAAAVADAVLDEALSGHTTAGTLGKALADIEADTNELQGDDVPGLIAALNDVAATDIVSGGAINTTAGAVDNVTTVATTTTNTDMRGTDSAATAAELAKVPKSDGTTSWNATALAAINAEVDTALGDYDGPTNAEMEARTPTAAQLAYITRHAATALPVTFTGGTTTTAVLGNVDGSAASSTDDVYNGRVLIFNAGTLDQQVTDITDYVGSTKTATITAVTTAVTSSHTAVMV